MLLKEQTIESLFPEFPEASKVWVYQSNRAFSEVEKGLIIEKATKFVSSWESHGSLLKADFAIVYDYFLVFVVDENKHEASGCSIDKSVHFVKSIQKLIGINFFDRTSIVYYKQDKTICLVPLSAVKPLIASGEISKDTLVFNNLAEYLDDLKDGWVVTADKTWIARLF